MAKNKNDNGTLEHIMQLFRGGNHTQGAEMLYNNYYYKIYGIAFSIVKNESASEDIVHNTMFRLLKTDKEKFPSHYESTWLYSVVKNEALIYLRKEKPAADIDNENICAFNDKTIEDFVDMESYYSMIKGLNEQQKQIVTLKVLGGYTHREIAKMLNKPIGTIQWIYNSSIKKLKILLSSQLSCVVLSGGLFGWRLTDYIERKNSRSEIPGGFTENVPVDCGMIVFGVIFVLMIAVFVFSYKKSHLIPTKAERKRI